MLNKHSRTQLTTEDIMQTCTPVKLIICTLPRGLASELMTQLYEQAELMNIQYITGRFQGAEDANNDWQEADVLQVFVKEELADSVFELMYRLANIELEMGRYLYQISLPTVTPFKLPLLRDLEELADNQL